MKKIAILIENFYEELELHYPYIRLKEAGFQVDLIGTQAGEVYKGKHGIPQKSDYSSKEVKAQDYDALVIPGGYSPDHMRRSESTKQFVRDMDTQGKLIAAICHAGWMLASCCNIKGKKMTSFFSIKDDLTNAGAEWVDEAVVVDGTYITSRTPADLIPFVKAIIHALE